MGNKSSVNSWKSKIGPALRGGLLHTVVAFVFLFSIHLKLPDGDFIIPFASVAWAIIFFILAFFITLPFYATRFITLSQRPQHYIWLNVGFLILFLRPCILFQNIRTVNFACGVEGAVFYKIILAMFIVSIYIFLKDTGKLTKEKRESRSHKKMRLVYVTGLLTVSILLFLLLREDVPAFTPGIVYHQCNFDDVFECPGGVAYTNGTVQIYLLHSEKLDGRILSYSMYDMTTLQRPPVTVNCTASNTTYYGKPALLVTCIDKPGLKRAVYTKRFGISVERTRFAGTWGDGSPAYNTYTNSVAGQLEGTYR